MDPMGTSWMTVGQTQGVDDDGSRKPRRFLLVGFHGRFYCKGPGTLLMQPSTPPQEIKSY